MQLKRINSAIDRVGRNDINENFGILERTYGKTAIDAQEAKTISEQAKLKSDNAVLTSGDAMILAESIQNQFNQVVIEGDSSIEAAQARVSADATTYDTLKARLDAENEQITQQLTQMTVNVRNFGAKGDGTTDDTTAFQNAITEAGAGGKIFVPKGTYIVNRLYLLNGQSVFGVGTSSVLKLKEQHIASPGGWGGVLNAFGNSTTPITNIHIYDLQVDGNKSGITTPNPNTDDLDIECINFKYAEDCTVQNVRAVNSVDSGVDFDTSKNCNVSNVRGINCGGYAVHLSTDSTNIVVSDSTAISCGVAHQRGGFDTWTGVNNCKYVNCHAIDCYAGFKILGNENQIINCSDVNSTQNSLRLEGSRNKIVNFSAKNSVNNSISIPSSYNELLNVSVDTANSGFFVDGSNNKFTNCTALNSNYGFRLNGQFNELVNCLSKTQYRCGFEIVGTRNSLSSCVGDTATNNALCITGDEQRIINFVARNNSVEDSAIRVDSNKNVFLGGTARDNAKSGMWINVKADNVIQGMSFINNAGNGIYLDGSTTKVIGCIFDNNTLGHINDTGSTNKYLMNIGVADK